jgi:hypothetical protein
VIDAAHFDSVIDFLVSQMYVAQHNSNDLDEKWYEPSTDQAHQRQGK